jgi:hypothetical protein
MCHYVSNAVRRNLVSAHVSSHFKRSKTKSGFCPYAITFQTQLDDIWFLRICHHILNALRRNLVSAHVPSHFKRSKTKSVFCARAITVQTQFTTILWITSKSADVRRGGSRKIVEGPRDSPISEKRGQHWQVANFQGWPNSQGVL